jgi:hypothetical protein
VSRRQAAALPFPVTRPAPPYRSPQTRGLALGGHESAPIVADGTVVGWRCLGCHETAVVPALMARWCPAKIRALGAGR